MLPANDLIIRRQKCVLRKSVYHNLKLKRSTMLEKIRLLSCELLYFGNFDEIWSWLNE